jgi:CRP-like cAMP-binding protein
VWFVELIGVTMNAFLLGKIVARLLDPHGRRFLFAYESFLSFLRFKRIDKRLEHEITHYFAYKWVTSHGVDDPQHVYRQLPETIRNHLKRDTCERFLINVSLFLLAPDPLRLLIAKALRPVEFAPGYTIVRQGDVSSDLLLLASGFIDVFVNDRRYAAMVACADGQSFGLPELLGLDLPRSASIKAVTHVSGWRLTRADLRAAVAHKPDMKEQLLEIVRLLFPDFLELVAEMLSEDAADLFVTVSDGSEGGMGIAGSDDEQSS